MQHIDVVVVGAGISGIGAAYNLKHVVLIKALLSLKAGQI